MWEYIYSNCIQKRKKGIFAGGYECLGESFDRGFLLRFFH